MDDQGFCLAGKCAYCGARLDRRYYFCPRCGTPHRALGDVLSAPMPEYLSGRETITVKAPYAKGLFLAYLSVVVGTGIASGIVAPLAGMMATLVMQAVVMVAITSIFAVRHWPALAVQFKQPGFGKAWAWIALGALAPVLAVNYYYHAWVIRQLGHGASPPAAYAVSPLVGTVFFCAMPALVEEIAFRGLLQHWLQLATSATVAISLASALFMSLHFSLISAPYLFAVGMLLGVAKYKTGSLYPPIAIHFIHNFVVVHYFT